jgi:hypothetical protein
VKIKIKTNNMKLKFKILLISLLILLIPLLNFAEPITIETATKVVTARITRAGKGNEFSIINICAVGDAGMILFYAAELSPSGYMIVAADDDLPPVIAYSYQDKLDSEGDFFKILKSDISHRLASSDKIPAAMISQRKMQWEVLISNNYKDNIIFTQWPPAGTTSTGGWLETNWTQNPPYNQMCPMDPVTSARSYVGCPATAMGQILNYHKTTNNTVFDDGDDYYHNYAGRTYWIDNDFAANGFPSFPELNVYLDTLNAHYQYNVLPTDQDKSALSFACGVAATQVFTSEGSGTFSVNQAYAAYQRFGCNTAALLFDTDTTLFDRLIQNMKDSLPAHFAIVDEANTTGHNVVVDGYNTDNFFHVNFGWGGSNNGWYLLPDEMPYSLTVIEGVIVDILKTDFASVPSTESNSLFEIFPNPAKEILTIELPVEPKDGSSVEIFSIDGKLLQRFPDIQKKTEADISAFSSGLYFVKVSSDNGIGIRKLIIE